MEIGPYKILSVLGEGGMGTVYLAEQQHPVRRRVALKVIKEGLATKDVLARFETEKQALALMNHPNIAKVYDADRTADGRPYFSMEYVPGDSIVEHCDRNRLSIEHRLDLFVQLCNGVQHAHQKGVIHRDLKPSNVMVQNLDGKPTVRIIDFGVAKALDHRLTEATVFTEQGRLIGTPEYMSPEQAEMSGVGVDTRTDVYSLGVLLYELLVGCLPFDAKEMRRAGYLEIQRRIREEEPMKPSTRFSTDLLADQLAARRRMNRVALLRRLRGDLDWITMMALEKDPVRRYASVSEFAADLQRFRRDEPVTARPPSASYRLRKFARRYRVHVISGTLILSTIVAGFVVSVLLYLAAERAREHEGAARRDADRLAGEARANAEIAGRRAAELQLATQDLEGQRQRADAAAADARKEGYVSGILAADAAGRNQGSVALRERLDACPEEYRGWEWAHLRRRVVEDPETLDAHEAEVEQIVFDRRAIYAATADATGAARLWNAEAATLLATIPGVDESVCVPLLAAEPVLLILGRANGQVAAYSVPQMTPAWSTELDGDPIRALIDAGSNCLVVTERAIRCHLLTDGSEAWRFDLQPHLASIEVAGRPSKGMPTSAALDPTGNYLAIGTANNVLVVDVEKRAVETSLHGSDMLVFDVTFSPEGRWLACGGGDHACRVWEVGSWEPQSICRGHLEPVTRTRFMTEDALLSVGWDSHLMVWEPLTGRQTNNIVGTWGVTKAMGIDTRRGSVWTTRGNMIDVWRGLVGNDRTTLRGLDGRTVRASPFGADHLAVSFDRRGAIDFDMKEPSVERIEEDRQIRFCAVSATGAHRCLVMDGGYYVEDVGHNARRWQAEQSGVVDAIFYDQGARLLVALASGRITARSTAGETLWSVQVPGGRGRLSERNGIMAWGSAAGVRVMTTDFGRFVIDLPADAAVRCVALKESGLFAGLDDGRILHWSALDAGVNPMVMRGHSAAVLTMALAPDGSRLASGGQDQTVRVWHAETGAQLLALREYDPVPNLITIEDPGVLDVRFSPDGATLYAAQGDQTVRAWFSGPPPPNLLEHQRRVRTRRQALRLVRMVVEGESTREAAEDAMRNRIKAPPEIEEMARKMLPIYRDSATRLNEIAWNIVRRADRKAEEYTHAEALAQRAAALAPENAAIRNTLGVALYRNGKLDESEVALLTSAKAHTGADRAVDLVFLAMIAARKGDVEKLAAYKAELPDRASIGPNRELASFLEELERVQAR